MKKLKEIVDELVKRGEDPAELAFWVAIFNHCTEEEQKKIMVNLEKELEDLKKTNQSQFEI